jgi:hypothetical protein
VSEGLDSYTQSATRHAIQTDRRHGPNDQDLPFVEVGIVHKAWIARGESDSASWSGRAQARPGNRNGSEQAHAPAEKPSTGFLVSSMSCRRRCRFVDVGAGEDIIVARRGRFARWTKEKEKTEKCSPSGRQRVLLWTRLRTRDLPRSSPSPTHLFPWSLSWTLRRPRSFLEYSGA